MAYGLKYYLDHYSTQGVRYYTKILKKDYTGDPIRLKYKDGGLVLNYDLGKWEEHIMKYNAKMSILYDSSNDFYVYEDLFTAGEKDFKLRIDASYNDNNRILFDGWVNPTPTTLNYLHNTTLNLTGSLLVKRMDELTAPILDTTFDPCLNDNVSFFNMMRSALELTGTYNPIYINNRLEPSGGLIDASTTTLYNRVALNPLVYWDDNSNKDSGTAIIESIMTSTDSYLYYYDGNWYIERYSDLLPYDWQKRYVLYDASTDYDFNDEGTWAGVYESSKGLPIECPVDVSAPFLGKSQKIKMNEAIGFLEIDLIEKTSPNFTINDFSQIVGTSASPQTMYPTYKDWTCTQIIYDGPDTRDFPGYRYGGQDSSKGFSLTEQFKISDYDTKAADSNQKVGPGYATRYIDNAIYRYDVPYAYSGDVFQNKVFDYAISTRFKVSIKTGWTSLNIKFKFIPDAVTYKYTSINEFDVSSAIYNKWTNLYEFDYKIKWALRAPRAPGRTAQALYWIMQNKTGAGDYIPDSWTYGYEASPSSYKQEIIVHGEDILNDIEINIPLGNVANIPSGDIDLVFTIWDEEIKLSDESNWRTQWLDVANQNYVLACFYGDVELTVSEEEQLKGIGLRAKITESTNAPEDVVKSLKIPFLLYDTHSLYFDNGPYTNSNSEMLYIDRTNLWREENGNVWRPLTDWFIHEKAKLYGIGRREISGTLRYYEDFLKPMDIWYDNYDPSARTYCLTKYQYDVGKDEYNCTWFEYDNSTADVNMSGSGEDIPTTSRPDRGSVIPATDRGSREVGDRVISWSVPRTRDRTQRSDPRRT